MASINTKTNDHLENNEDLSQQNTSGSSWKMDLQKYASAITEKISAHLPSKQLSRVLVLVPTMGMLWACAPKAPNTVAPQVVSSTAPSTTETKKTGDTITKGMETTEAERFLKTIDNGLSTMILEADKYLKTGVAIREGDAGFANGNRLLKVQDEKGEVKLGILMRTTDQRDMDFPVSTTLDKEASTKVTSNDQKLLKDAMYKAAYNLETKKFVISDKNEDKLEMWLLPADAVKGMEKVSETYEATLKNAKTGEVLVDKVVFEVSNNVSKLPTPPEVIEKKFGDSTQSTSLHYPKNNSARAQVKYIFVKKPSGPESTSFFLNTNIKNSPASEIRLYATPTEKEVPLLTNNNGKGLQLVEGGVSGLVNTIKAPEGFTWSTAGGENNQLNLHPLSLKDFTEQMSKKIEEEKRKNATTDNSKKDDTFYM
jgi:cytochrome b involved in lipid metabolism